MHDSMPSQNTDAHTRMRFLGIAVALTFLAFILRVLYWQTAQIDFPIRGDILGYWTYATNLATHGIFSSSSPEAATITPDSFRGPGYPLFLAVWMKLTTVPQHAVVAAQAAQILVGSALVPLTIALATSWLRRSTALMAGLLVALWPHLIVFSSTLLSETFFAFTLLSMALVMVTAQRRSNRALGLLSGLFAGLAYLVNPIVLFFPIGVAGLLASRKQVGVGLALLLGFSLVVGGWSLRNASLPDSAGAGERAAMNLVEGSWPLYHDAHNDESINEVARSVANAIREEEQLMIKSPTAGLTSMWGRFREDPAYYLSWYVFQKPYLLWDWRIRIGWGDVYFVETHNSPFERSAAMVSMHELFRWSNPFFFGLAMLVALTCCLREARQQPQPFALALVALFFVYITAIHVVFQAEPRYSVAYRPFEVLLAVTIASAAVKRFLVPASLVVRPHP